MAVLVGVVGALVSVFADVCVSEIPEKNGFMRHYYTHPYNLF